MKLSEAFMCAGLVFWASTAHGGIVPSKAGLSLKDKLALDIPVKQLITDKTGEKSETAKVSFPTTPATTTTTALEIGSKPQRPKYVDATVFRHQFTTPSTSSSSSFSPVDDPIDFVSFSTSHHIPASIGFIDSELGLVTDRKSESFRRGFVPMSFGFDVPEPVSSALTNPSSTTERGTTTTTTTESFPKTTSTTNSPTSTTTASPAIDFEVADYDAHFRFTDDLSPFSGELGILGGDRRSESFVSVFRPLGF